MKVNKNTINDYLEGKHFNEWDNQWIFHSIIEKEYLIETVGEDKKGIIQKTTKLLENELINFQPYNKDIWYMIFPNWQDIISNLTIYLIVGSPNPYDAMTRISPDGEEVIIFDINRMLSYGDEVENLVATIKSLLTHEYAHTCLHSDYPVPDSTSNFSYKLQYICFDEGIAHFLSFNKNVKSVNWLDNDKIQKKENAYAMLKRAIYSNNKHEELLEKANSAGFFWDKFGAISGLFAIADKFVQSNYNYYSLFEVYKNGPKKFLIDIFSIKREVEFKNTI